MAQPRLYKRVRPSGQMGRTATIIVGAKAPVINCTIVDYSAGGACIEVYGKPRCRTGSSCLYGSIRKGAAWFGDVASASA